MKTGPTTEMRARRAAASAVLHAYHEGRPIAEIRSRLPQELEATGQRDAAEMVRAFFKHPKLAGAQHNR